MSTLLEIIEVKHELIISDEGNSVTLEVFEDSEVHLLETGMRGLEGPPGPPGPSGINIIIGEIPAGLINGSNAIFTTQYTFIPETVQIILNGLIQEKIIDFNTSGDQQIIMLVSPENNSNLMVNYVRS